LRFIRIFRLMRLMRFKQLFQRWSTSFGISYAKLTLLRLMAALVMCAHWMACLWGGLAKWASVRGESNWLTALRNAKGTPDLSHDDHFDLYSLSLYWAIITITSIGYGDITPQTMTEYRVATVCSTIMASIWAYVIGAICGIVSTLDQHEVSFKRTMDDLNWFMEEKEMPNIMRQRLRRYFFEAKEMSKQKVEKEVITQMSPLLQGEVSMFMHQQWICRVWYLCDMNREIIVWAARNLALAVFAPNEEVLDERTLFIVQRGVCAYKGKILVSGDIWGEDMLLSNPFLREQCKARAMSHLAVLTLHIEDLFEVVVCFSEARARLRWAQIQIATHRGIVRIARKLRAMREQQGLSLWDLDEEERISLYQDILQGSTGDDEDINVTSSKTDFFDIPNARRKSNASLEAAGPNLDARSEALAGMSDALGSFRLQEGSGLSRPTSPDRSARSGEFVALRTMQISMLELGQSVEELKNMVQSSKQGFSGGSFNTTLSRELSRTKRLSTGVDFGPLPVGANDKPDRMKPPGQSIFRRFINRQEYSPGRRLAA